MSKYLRTWQVAERWNVSDRTVRRMIEDGRIKNALLIGKYYRIPMKSILDYEEQNQVENYDIE